MCQKELNVGSGNADSVASRVDGDLIEALEFLGDHEEQDANREQFIQLMRVCYKKNVLDMIQWSEEISSVSREQQKVFLKYALHMFRQSMLRNYTEDMPETVKDTYRRRPQTRIWQQKGRRGSIYRFKGTKDS